MHFEPVAPLSEPNPVFQGDLPPYIILNSPEEPNWRSQNPNGWNAVRTAPLTAGTTEAHQSALAGDEQQLRALLDSDPRLALAKDDNGWTPLHEATRFLRTDLVQLLVERGADIHAVTRAGDSTLRLAYEAVEALDPEYQANPQAHPIIQYLEGLGAKRFQSPGSEF